jgi:hypothetical protein
MSRHPTRLLLPTLALIAFTLLNPTLATAFPQDTTLRSAAEHSAAAPGLFSKLWGLLSAVWATGSILEPNGSGASAAPGTEPNGGSSGDTGSGLEPNG